MFLHWQVTSKNAQTPKVQGFLQSLKSLLSCDSINSKLTTSEVGSGLRKGTNAIGGEEMILL